MNSGIKACTKEYGKATRLRFTRPVPGPGDQTMFYLKACPKCQGDLTLEKDAYGAFLKCLQCGKLTEVNESGGKKSVLHGATFDEVAIQALTKERAKTLVAA